MTFDVKDYGGSYAKQWLAVLAYIKTLPPRPLDRIPR